MPICGRRPAGPLAADGLTNIYEAFQFAFEICTGGKLDGVRPVITVKSGEPIPTIRKILDEDENISALVLGAAAQGAPGPLVAHQRRPGRRMCAHSAG